MSDEKVFKREQMIQGIVSVIELLETVSSFVAKRLCEDCETAEEEWAEKKSQILKQLRNLIGKYDFARYLPKDESGISAQAILHQLIKIQYTFSQIVVLIDMIRGEPFGDVYLDSITSISSKMNQQLVAIKNLAKESISNKEAAIVALRAVERLEREIDEDNIVICRQISVASVDGETDFTCYIMRKIVSEMEHISDYIKAAAEILVDI
ncbi:MAG: hypothetical protein ACFFD3_04685 [Candidatus Thorarchaeota archaeon]